MISAGSQDCLQEFSIESLSLHDSTVIQVVIYSSIVSDARIPIKSIDEIFFE